MRLPPVKRRFVHETMIDPTPIDWKTYFDVEEDVRINEDFFHVYIKGADVISPVIFAVHGAGYNALTWSLFAHEVFQRISCKVIAVDLRGHGKSNTKINDLRLKILAEDVINLLNVFCGGKSISVILIGHSMGGAVVVEVAPKIPNLQGLCVIDAVEGTVFESFASMRHTLRERPKSFDSVKHSIIWSFNSGETTNLTSARVSMPGRIINRTTGQLAADEEFLKNLESKISFSRNSNDSSDDFQDELNYVWKVDLCETEEYWEDWYRGLSQKFLEVSVPRVLILASINALDTTLTIGQMQGKFQVRVLNKCGHTLQEDEPSEVADIVAGFIVQQRITTKKSDFVLDISTLA